MKKIVDSLFNLFFPVYDKTEEDEKHLFGKR